MKAAGIGVEQAIHFTKIASNDLPALEQKYQKLKREVNSLESRKLEEYRTLNDLQDQIDGYKRMLEWLRTSYHEEEANVDKLEREKIRLKRFVKRFKNNNEEYLKIEKTVGQRVTSLLFDVKGILRLSLDSLMKSMRTDPQKYSKLIYYNRSSSARNIDWQYTGYNYIHGQQPYASFDNFYEEYKSTFLEDAEKLYNKSVKEWTEQQQFHYKPSNKPPLLTLLRTNQARGKCVFVKTLL